jgi:hypothetical protein
MGVTRSAAVNSVDRTKVGENGAGEVRIIRISWSRLCTVVLRGVGDAGRTVVVQSEFSRRDVDRA